MYTDDGRKRRPSNYLMWFAIFPEKIGYTSIVGTPLSKSISVTWTNLPFGIWDFEQKCMSNLVSLSQFGINAFESALMFRNTKQTKNTQNKIHQVVNVSLGCHLNRWRLSTDFFFLIISLHHAQFGANLGERVCDWSTTSWFLCKTTDLWWGLVWTWSCIYHLRS